MTAFARYLQCMPSDRWRRQLGSALGVVCVAYPRTHACKAAAYIPLRAPNGRWQVEQWSVMRDDGAQHESWDLDAGLSPREVMQLVREEVAAATRRTGAEVTEVAMNPEHNVDRFLADVRHAGQPERAVPKLAAAV